MPSNSFSLYIHIPFCISRCNYCNYFTRGGVLHLMDSYIQSLCREIFLASQTCIPEGGCCTSIYFGGGTPSLLSKHHLKNIMEAVNSVVSLNDTAEITLESNPQDINSENLQIFSSAGINRLSIGCQSFQDSILLSLNRRHTAKEARQAIRLARKAGFHNLSVDLIFGVPGQTIDIWKKDLAAALKFSPEHISLYNLTIEPKTPLYKRYKKGLLQLPGDAISAEMFTAADEYLASAGYNHYEISNFALEGYPSLHNSSYWVGAPYVGFGAGAHSYVNGVRSWNVKNFQSYGKLIAMGRLPRRKSETLTADQKFLEKVMLSLRTERGLDMSTVELHYRKRIETNIEKMQSECEESVLEIRENRVFIPREKWVIADEIITRLIP